MLAQDPLGPADLTDPQAVAKRLEGMRDAGASAAVTALLSRDPASHARLNDTSAVAFLMQELRQCEADSQVTVLADRAANHAGIESPKGVAELLDAMRQAGASGAIAILLARDPARYTELHCQGSIPGLDHSSSNLSELLEALHDAGAGDAVTALATRCYNAGMFSLAYLHFVPQYPSVAVAAQAVITLLLVRPRVSELSHLAPRVAALTQAGLHLGLLLAPDTGRSPAEPAYSADEIAMTLRVPVYGRVPDDPGGAAHLVRHLGQFRTRRRLPLARSAAGIAASLAATPSDPASAGMRGPASTPQANWWPPARQPEVSAGG